MLLQLCQEVGVQSDAGVTCVREDCHFERVHVRRVFGVWLKNVRREEIAVRITELGATPEDPGVTPNGLALTGQLRGSRATGPPMSHEGEGRVATSGQNVSFQPLM
ncbi:hypothetical protein HOK021_59480 [Streptomyces hygroscopicus]|nr:hypothetical protein HOK021_59480 [Streptomyces hygroscopicus]